MSLHSHSGSGAWNSGAGAGAAAAGIRPQDGQATANTPLKIGMVAGEPSGDLLASRIIQGIRGSAADAVCEGIGGSRMREQGFDMRHPMHALSVFGYVDALKQLPRLLRIYGDTKKHWLRHRPDVFVGIDAPDFNLRLEHQLRKAGVPTVHFVGPSIWAWRYERIHAIREAVSHMLVLFPFEEALYRKEGVPVTYVGHPLASVIPRQADPLEARERLGIAAGARVLAMLPGSRSSEVKLLAPRFLQAVQRLQDQDPALVVAVPMVSEQRKHDFEQALRLHPIKNLHLVQQQDGATRSDALVRPVAWDVLQASDAVLVASGTATLETALFKKPMVISYVLSPMMRRLMAWKSGQERPYVPWVGLPNVLANDFVVPELLQEEATPDALAQATWKALTDAEHRAKVCAVFERLHADLERDTPALAAQAILREAGHGAG